MVMPHTDILFVALSFNTIPTMGIFDFFRSNKQKSYDPMNMSVLDLDEGFVFDYDLKSWTVKNRAVYDWGDNCFTHEYKISDGNNTYYLSVEQDDGTTVEISSPLSLAEIDENVPKYIDKNEKAPFQITYNGNEYRLIEESPGYYQKSKNADWDEFISWRYESRQSKYFIEISQWDEFEFEASIGFEVKESKISNILPR